MAFAQIQAAPFLPLPWRAIRDQACCVSKAFTREDADASFSVPPPSSRSAPHPLTAYGARLLRLRRSELDNDDEHAVLHARLQAILDHAFVLDPAGGERVALGARVVLRSEANAERTVVLVTPDEVGFVPSGISAAAPLGRALVGSRAGESVTVELPRGTEELTIVAVDWPS